MSAAVPRLYLVTDRHATGGRPLSALLADAFADLPAWARGTGAVAVQLREKDLDGRALTALGHELRAVTAAAGVALYVNDRVDVALAIGADGVHLPGRGLPPDEVVRLAPSLAIAVSTHSRADVAAAARAPGVRFAVFGPVFDTPAKRAFGPPVGLPALQAAAELGLPLLALGGVSPETAAACRAAGAVGVAVIRAVLSAPEPARAVGALLALFPSPTPARNGRT
jgi:thiamine-phosphate pyrophosphorylase